MRHPNYPIKHINKANQTPTNSKNQRHSKKTRKRCCKRKTYNFIRSLDATQDQAAWKQILTDTRPVQEIRAKSVRRMEMNKRGSEREREFVHGLAHGTSVFKLTSPQTLPDRTAESDSCVRYDTEAVGSLGVYETKHLLQHPSLAPPRLCTQIPSCLILSRSRRYWPWGDPGRSPPIKVKEKDSILLRDSWPWPDVCRSRGFMEFFLLPFI